MPQHQRQHQHQEKRQQQLSGSEASCCDKSDISCSSSCCSSLSSLQWPGGQTLYRYEAKRAGGVYEQMMRVVRAGNNSNTQASIRDVQVHKSQNGQNTRVEIQLEPTGSTADLNINIIMDSDSNLSNVIPPPSIEYESLDQTGNSGEGRIITRMSNASEPGTGTTDTGGGTGSGSTDSPDHGRRRSSGWKASRESSAKTSENELQHTSLSSSSGGGGAGGSSGGGEEGGGEDGGGEDGGGEDGGGGSGGEDGGGGSGGEDGGGGNGGEDGGGGSGGEDGDSGSGFPSAAGEGAASSEDRDKSSSSEAEPSASKEISSRGTEDDEEEEEEDGEGGEGEEGDMDDAQRHFNRYLDSEKVEALRGPGKEGDDAKEMKKKLPVGYLQKEGVVIGCMSVFADVHVKEYIVFLSDEMIQAFLVDPGRFRSVANRTKCEIEVTRRILNRRMSRYRWLKYLIVNIRGPCYSAIDQCDKMMMMLFPPYKGRKPYGVPAFASLYLKETTPDNTDLYFNFQRTGPAQSMYGEIPLRAPFRKTKLRSLETTPWKSKLKRQQWGILEPKNNRMETVMTHVYPERGGTFTNPLDQSMKWAEAAEQAVAMTKAKDVARALMLKARKMKSEPLFSNVVGE